MTTPADASPAAGEIKLTARDLEMLRILAEGNPLGLRGLAQIMVAQRLIDNGLARHWLMGTIVITEVGRSALAKVSA